jgi:ferric-dicitrate binding protein FerR (iron transport regulator)
MKRKGVSSDANISQEAADWIATLVDSPSRRTVAAARRWVRQSPEHCSEFLAAAELYRLLKGLGPTRAGEVEALLAELDTVVPFAPRPGHVRSAEPVRQTPWPVVAAAAAGRAVAVSGTDRGYRGARLLKVAALVLLSILAFVGDRSSDSDARQEYVSGSRPETIWLGHGTVIYMTAGSAVAVTRTPRTLSVTLEKGEALFDVNHQHRRWQPQLWVFSAGMRVRDIGTRFDVRRRSDGILVSVMQGRVQIDSLGLWELPPSAQSRDGAPGSDAILADAGQEVDIRTAQALRQARILVRADTELQSPAARASGWVDFTGERLSQAVLQFNKRGRPTVVMSPSVASLRVGGRFRANDFEGWLATLPYVGICVERIASAGGPGRVVLSKARGRVDAGAHGDRFSRASCDGHLSRGG